LFPPGFFAYAVLLLLLLPFSHHHLVPFTGEIYTGCCSNLEMSVRHCMEKRKLGRQGLAVSALGLGCMGMSWAYGGADDAESNRVIRHALDIGVDFLDTAETYGPFTNEEL